MNANVLPDLFLRADGTRVVTPSEWPQQRDALGAELVEIAFGGLPPAPQGTRGDLLNTHRIARFADAEHRQYRLVTGPAPAVSFTLDLLIPKAEGPCPVILNGDGCWRYITDEIIDAVLARGYILATFNRVELAPDVVEVGRSGGLYAAAPDGTYGAIAAWAWGYHRCVDFLTTLLEVDVQRIAICGHSRGGKAVLLAGATDARIALTAPNNSGCAGAGCFRIADAKAESLRVITDHFPHWFGPKLRSYADDPSRLPFDLHTLKAWVAPRSLLTTEALGDLWANPFGTWLTHLAAAEVYAFLGAREKLGIVYREGGHAHGAADWKTLLDFADWQFRDRKPGRRFDVSPFTGALPTS